MRIIVPLLLHPKSNLRHEGFFEFLTFGVTLTVGVSSNVRKEGHTAIDGQVEDLFIRKAVSTSLFPSLF